MERLSQKRTRQPRKAKRVVSGHDSLTFFFINWNFQYGGAGWEAYKGRLNHQTTYLAGNNNKGQWLQVDFGKVVKVTKIATQGRHNANQYITKYVVSSSLDGSLFQFQEHKPYTVPRVGCKSIR